MAWSKREGTAVSRMKDIRGRETEGGRERVGRKGGRERFRGR